MIKDKNSQNPSNPQPLFLNNPTDRTQPDEVPETSLLNPYHQTLPDKNNVKTATETIQETAKDIPQQTRSSRITRTLLKLDDKDRKVVKALSQGKDDKEALKSAGYSDSYIKNEGRKLIAKPVIQSALQTILDNSGVTDNFLAEKLKEGLDATKIHGTSDDFIEIKDYAVRHKYLETGLKLKGHLDKKVDIVHHKSHEDQLRELQDGEVIEADYEEILPD